LGSKRTLFTNVRVFDGTGSTLSGPCNVLVQGDTIARIDTQPIPADSATVIDGQGRTLMPGLIDAHTHLMFSTVPLKIILGADIGFLNLAAGKGATEMLMRGFTSVRDLGGPVFGLKLAIDSGILQGPRIWPSGAFISQSGGHGDMRMLTEIPARPDDVPYIERVGVTAIADDAATVRKRAREQLMLGASQLKLMAGGGVASPYDPLEVTQYTEEEIRAAVEAAENWGTYVTVHAYTPRAVRQSIAAGVKCIDHGQLLDDATAKLMADKGIWWSLQPFLDDGHSTFPPGSPNWKKQEKMRSGTDAAYALAKKHGVRTAWGTDILFSATSAAQQNSKLTVMTRWYTPAEVLRMATSDNAALLALSGERSPYAGRFGVVQVGAVADLLLVDGDPLANIDLLNDPARNLVLIMKGGHVVKQR
jgi:imidazolonepropionase-like amidohydrolase